jgi:hypothetical protein
MENIIKIRDTKFEFFKKIEFSLTVFKILFKINQKKLSIIMGGCFSKLSKS